MMNPPKYRCILMLKLAFISVLIEKIAISEGFVFDTQFDHVNYGLAKNITLLSGICNYTFEQKLDHFDPTDNRTWNQTYYEFSYYKRGGPVYLRIGGEDEADPAWLQTGYFHDHGKENNAKLFLVEHRFYGKSQPLKNTETKHLKYLTTNQALADLASFIEFINEAHNLPETTKWIVFGCSYAGNLAAWMRLKYPHLVHAAVASSAPVLAKVKFPEYFDAVSNSLASYNKRCQRDIAYANKMMDIWIRIPWLRQSIGKYFNLCTNGPSERSQMDLALMFDLMAGFVSAIVQHDHFGKNVGAVCDIMLDTSYSISPVKRYANLINALTKNNYGSCLQSDFDSYVKKRQNIDLKPQVLRGRTWLYQKCTEFGYFGITRESNNTFSTLLTLDFQTELCRRVFETSFTNEFISQAVNNTNKFFGGLKINVDRLVFIHGESDPYRSLGITNSTEGSKFETILVKGAAHCSDTHSDDLQDPPCVRVARKRVRSLLSKWLKED